MSGLRHSSIALVVFLLGAAEPSTGLQFDLTTLSGQRSAGQLRELVGDHLTLKSGNAETRVPLAEVLELRAVRTKPAVPPDVRRPELTLTDGSRIFWSALRVGNDRQVSVETPQFGKFNVPLNNVASIRLAPVDAQIADKWKELSARESTQDMLIIRKGNNLDHLDGTVGAIDEKRIHFVYEGEEVPDVKRENVFAVVFARRNGDAGKPVCEVSALGGDLLKAQTAVWDATGVRIGIGGGAQLTIPAEQVTALDFSLGKVRYLSDMEPREVKYTPFFDQVWTYYRDSPRDGGALRLRNKEYARGLWIHSRTLLKYRLNGDYRRFQAVMGIDQAVAPLGNVHVVLSGDGKTLYESEVRGSDAPRNLDLDVAGVRELEILVDFGGDLDIADHLDLADAKVIK